jgi:hypothetical protein
MTVTPSPSPPSVKLRPKTNTFRRRAPWVIGLIVLVLVIAVALTATTSKDGSTYSYAPAGYQKWYAYMKKQDGITIGRWQRNYKDLAEQEAPDQELIESQLPQIAPPNAAQLELTAGPATTAASNLPLNAPQTMLRISSQPDFIIGILPEPLREWVEAGNTVIQMGWFGQVSGAPFSSTFKSPVGEVLVETTRRIDPDSSYQPLLADEDGAVVWKSSLGKGQIIFAAYPWLAANAHADQAKNFAYLAKLASQQGGKIWVDELLHGFRDRSKSDTGREREISDVFAYIFRNTPALALLCQAILMTLVAIWSLNWRFGPIQSRKPPEPENSERYVEALASVLNQAQHTDFVAAQLGLRLRQELASQLGLAADRTPSARLPDDQTIAQAWAAQTGRPAQEVLKLLQQSNSGKRWSDAELQAWAVGAASLAMGKGVAANS